MSNAQRILVAFYSSTGNTKAVAEAVARELGCDIEAIEEPKSRQLYIPPRGLRGFWDFMQAGFEAITARTVPLSPMRRDPSNYDLAIVGTPVWAGTVSSPTRSFLAQYGPSLKRTAFFWTGGDVNNPRVVPAMIAVSGQEALASAFASADQVKSGRYMEQVESLVRSLRDQHS